MKNVKKLLIFAAISTFVFASSTRTDALGGAKYWADDYSNIAAFPASVNDHNVAYTNNGDNFTSIFDKDGTTWGFSGGTGNDVANIMWGNGSLGVTFGLSMLPEDEDASPAVEGETNMSIGVGTALAGGDFGFRLGKSIALGMVKPALATTGQKLKIDILGKMHDATILDESPYDSENKLLRA